MRLLNPLRLGRGSSRSRSSGHKKDLTSHPVEGPFTEGEPEVVRLDVRELSGINDEEECEPGPGPTSAQDPAGDEDEPEPVREATQDCSRTPEGGEEDGIDEAEDTKEQQVEPEMQRAHEPMVRGDAARGDAPYPASHRSETIPACRRPVRQQRAWYLSEPISVERWQSAPHLRSGFSSG